MTMLYQCDLVAGTKRTRAYIDAKGAVVGNTLTLTDSEDDETRWTVTSVPPTGIDEKYLKELQRAYRDQRDASDI